MMRECFPSELTDAAAKFQQKAGRVPRCSWYSHGTQRQCHFSDQLGGRENEHCHLLPSGSTCVVHEFMELSPLWTGLFYPARGYCPVRGSSLGMWDPGNP